mmetsp:Transcript_23570/g.59799  ORF Transcript_23570/g.59799 Transcript_23570/m.59799 type:complete len:222 (-) Transcript_23570:57-722(-)
MLSQATLLQRAVRRVYSADAHVPFPAQLAAQQFRARLHLHPQRRCVAADKLAIVKFPLRVSLHPHAAVSRIHHPQVVQSPRGPLFEDELPLERCTLLANYLDVRSIAQMQYGMPHTRTGHTVCRHLARTRTDCVLTPAQQHRLTRRVLGQLESLCQRLGVVWHHDLQLAQHVLDHIRRVAAEQAQRRVGAEARVDAHGQGERHVTPARAYRPDVAVLKDGG